MTVGTFLLLILLAFPAGCLWLAWGGYRTCRGTRQVTCPADGQFATLELDAGHAALSAVLGRLDLRVAGCSRWPGRQDCGQECLRVRDHRTAQAAETPHRDGI